MLNGIDAVIFDLDGTVIDSMWMWETIDIKYLKKFNIPFVKDYQKEIEGMSFNETAVYFKSKFNITDSLEKMKADWNEMAREMYRNVIQPKPGVIDFLKKLRSKGIRTGIGTSNSMELCRTILDSKGLVEYFDEVHTANEVKAGKPSPDIYLLVAEKLGVEPSRCIVFEDLYQGICAGINAGMRTCAVADEYSRNSWNQKIEAADYAIMDYCDAAIVNWR